METASEIAPEPWWRRRPRLAAALAFGAAGLLLPALWYLPVTLRGRHAALLSFLYVGAPGVAAGIAGALLGRPLLRPAPASHAGRAALRGAAIATLALLIFAPLFATLFTATDSGPVHWNVLGLIALLLAGSAVAAWVPAAALGACVGWLLFHLGRRAGS